MLKIIYHLLAHQNQVFMSARSLGVSQYNNLDQCINLKKAMTEMNLWSSHELIIIDYNWLEIDHYLKRGQTTEV